MICEFSIPRTTKYKTVKYCDYNEEKILRQKIVDLPVQSHVSNKINLNFYKSNLDLGNTQIRTYDNFLNFSRTELSSLEVLLRKLFFSDEGLLDVPLNAKE